MNVLNVVRRLALAALLLGLVAPPAQAYIYFTCRGPDGQLVFTDAGCAQLDATVPLDAEDEPEPVAEESTSVASPGAPAAPARPPVEAHGAVIEAPPVQAPAPSPAVAAPARVPSRAAASQLPPEFTPVSPPPAQRTLLSLSLVLVLLSWLWLTTQGFRRGPLWGWSLLLLSPPAMLAYGFRHPRAAAPGLGLAVAAAALAVTVYVRPVDVIMVTDAHLTDAPGTRLPQQRKPRARFTLADTVYYKTVLDWDDPWLRGTHTVRWVWLSGRQPPVENSLPVRFGRAPLALQGWVRAAELGRGPHAVQIYVDDRLLDQRRFDVRR